jgi:hypothetical protein
MNMEALKLKFRDCIKKQLTPEMGDRALELLADLEHLSDIGELVQTLTPLAKVQIRGNC